MTCYIHNLVQVRSFLDDTSILNTSNIEVILWSDEDVQHHQDNGDDSKDLASAAICIENKGKLGAYSNQLIIQFAKTILIGKLQLKAEVFATFFNVYIRKNVKRTLIPKRINKNNKQTNVLHWLHSHDKQITIWTRNSVVEINPFWTNFPFLYPLKT